LQIDRGAEICGSTVNRRSTFLEQLALVQPVVRQNDVG